MSQKPKKGRPKLGARKELLLHSYDSFLISQTRLFTLAHSAYHFESSEIATKQNILFLDDILNFAITARRLIELAGLESFSGRQLVPVFQADNGVVQKSNMGFQKIINSVIHSRFINLVTNNFPGFSSSEPTGVELARYVEMFEGNNSKEKWRKYSVDPAIIVIPDKSPSFSAFLADVIATSVEVSDKVVDVCIDSHIFLEFEYRGL